MTQLTRTPPTGTLRDLQREVDDLFDRFFSRPQTNERSPALVWSPRTDLTETDEDFRLRLDVPGMSKEDINVNLQNCTLTITGERSRERSHEDEESVRIERTFGTFHRTFTLPEAIDADRIEATYDDGVLTIHVPKTEENTRRQIEIR